MKKYSILLFMVIFVFVSCKKTDSSLINNNNLAGTWLLKQYAGGISYQVFVAVGTNIIIFKKSGDYIATRNDTITAQGTFTISKVPNVQYYSNTVVNLLSTNGNHITYGARLTTDSLILSEGCCDQYNYTYTRK